jgi:OmpA-OmpF porin, OOP family
MPNSKLLALRPLQLAACLVLSSLSFTRVAGAQYSLNQEFSKGFSLLRFEPSPAGDRFFSVPDAYVPGNDRSRFRAMLAFNVPLAPILTRTDNQTGQSADIVAEQFVSYLDVGYFPTKWLLLNADMPLVLSQSGDGRSAPSGSALGDARIGLRVSLLGSENAAFSLAPALDVWLPTGSVDQLTGDGRVRALPKVLASGRSHAFIWSSEVGYQLRRSYDSGSQEIGNGLVLGGAAGLLLFGDMLQVGAEIYGSTLIASMRGSAFDAPNTALEALFGGHVHAGSFVFGAAGGPGLGEAPGSAPRLVLTLAYAPALKYRTPLEVPTSTLDDRDQDGIQDSRDACPDAKGPAREDASVNGCPDVTPLQQDKDDDGIDDADDACPTERGERSNDKTKNGCPVQSDRDGDGIVDNDDACPDQKGEPSTDPKLRGCPAPATASDGEVDDTDPPGHAEVTFAGFRETQGGRAQVTIELTGPVAVKVKKDHDKLIYELLDTKIPQRNNENPLLTNEFPSSIVSAVLSADKKSKSARLVLQLRSDFEPRHRLVKRNGGAALVIELPAPAPNTIDTKRNTP